MEGVSSATASANNGAAIVTLAAPPAGQSHYIYGVTAGFSAAATKLLTVKDGATVVENIPVVNAYQDNRSRPLKISTGNACEVSLAASGTPGVVGYVTIRYETR